jgi:hypothetical protein
MSSSSKDLGVITVLLQRLEQERLPVLMPLKKRIDAGETLTDSELEYLKDLIEEVHEAGLYPLIERHPDYRHFLATVLSFYEELVGKALENEQRAQH